MNTGKVIDVHAHLTPQCFLRVVKGGGTWHGLSDELGELWNPANHWPPARRLEEMDRMGVDMQVVSPTDCFYQYDKPVETTVAIANDVNAEIAEMVRGHPDRFLGLGTVPMQEPDRAAEMLATGMKDLGLVGFMIDDHVNGVMYDDERFTPFWEAADEFRAFILIHQYAPTVVALRTQRHFLHNSIGNLVDRTLSYSTLVYGGIIDSYPGIRFCLAHSGGYVPYALDRLDKGWEMFPDERAMAREKPSTYARRFLYDTVLFTETNLRFLVDQVGADRVLFGTDWPAPMQVEDAVEWLKGTKALSDSEREQILHRGAREWITGAPDDGRLSENAQFDEPRESD